MTSEEPKVSANGRYPMGETATILAVSRTTLNKYATLGLIKCGYRKANCRRFVKGSEILRFWNAQM